MDFISRSTPYLQNAISTGLDSITAGIAQTAQAAGPAAPATLDSALSTFTSMDVNTQSFLASQPQVSAPAEFPDPATFLSNFNAQAVPSSGSGEVFAALTDPQFRPASELTGVLKGIGSPAQPDRSNQSALALQDMHTTVSKLSDMQRSTDLQLQLAQASGLSPNGSGGLRPTSHFSAGGSAQGSWQAAQIGVINYQDSGDWGRVSAKGQTDILKVDGSAYANVDVDTDNYTVGASAGAQGTAEIAHSHYDFQYDTPSVYNLGGHDLSVKTDVNADAKVWVHGFANADISLGKDTDLSLGAGGFEGASASLSGSANVSDLGGVHGSVTGWTGAGAKCDFDAGIKDGDIHFDFGAGLALGIGLDYDLGFDINVPKVWDGFKSGVSDVVDGAGDAAQWLGGATKSAANLLGDVANGATNVASQVVDVGSDVVDFLGGAAEDAGDAAGDAIDAVGDAAGDAADAVGDAADAVGDAVSDVVDW